MESRPGRQTVKAWLMTCLAFLMTLLGGCHGPGGAPTANEAARRTLSSAAVEVIAHRGASAERPENTMSSFRRAAELEADRIELDVQLTRDGQVVVFHDADLDRTTDGSGPLTEHTWDELSRLDAGSWMSPEFAGERIPRLVEVLEW